MTLGCFDPGGGNGASHRCKEQNIFSKGSRKGTKDCYLRDTDRKTKLPKPVITVSREVARGEKRLLCKRLGVGGKDAETFFSLPVLHL